MVVEFTSIGTYEITAYSIATKVVSLNLALFEVYSIQLYVGKGNCANNATFKNISVISWRPVLLVEETVVLGENHRPAASHWQTWFHNDVSSSPLHEQNSML